MGCLDTIFNLYCGCTEKNQSDVCCICLLLFVVDRPSSHNLQSSSEEICVIKYLVTDFVRD